MNQILLLLLLIGGWGCARENVPHSVLDADRFDAIYIALLDSVLQIQAAPTDSLIHPIAERILERHGATVEQFRATVAYYNADSNRWKKFFERVIRKLEQRRTPKSAG